MDFVTLDPRSKVTLTHDPSSCPRKAEKLRTFDRQQCAIRPARIAVSR
jgi:hypothetical protein